MWLGLFNPQTGSPQTPNNMGHDIRHERHHVSVDVHWEASEYADNYFIFVFPPLADSESIFTTTNTTFQLSMSYSEEYNISVFASNCARNSTPVITSVFVGENITYNITDCSVPTVDPNVSVEGYSSGVEGSQITYYCQPGMLPSELMVANCMSDGSWNPDPSGLECYAVVTTPIYSTSIPG